MKLLFVTDARFHKTVDGTIYSGEYSFSNILWKRYLSVFSDVKVLARLFNINEFDFKSHIVDSVEILPLPSFETPVSFMLQKNKINKQIKSTFEKYQPDCIIIRGAGSIGYLVAKYCVENNIPYGIEVVGDPQDVYAPGVIKHPLRSIFRYLFTYYQKEAVSNAIAVLYVTSSMLQKRYPASDGAFSTNASNVTITDVSDELKKLDVNKKVELLSIGSLEQLYKAPDVVLKALQVLRNKGLDVNLTWLGKGKYLTDMELLANNLDVQSSVTFKGSVDSFQVTEYINKSQIFVLVSRTEGLPRAIIEAMARGVPCIGTRIGGIPELVNEKLLVDVEDSVTLAEKIIYLIENPEFYKQMSQHSLNVAKDFKSDLLDSKRNKFYNFLKKGSINET